MEASPQLNLAYYWRLPVISFFANRKDIENVNIGLKERIKTLKICQDIIHKKLEYFMQDSDIPNETLQALYKEALNNLKFKQEKFELLINKNIFEYDYDQRRVLITDYKYKILILDHLEFTEYFTQRMVKNVKRSSDDLVGDLKNQAILSENFELFIEGHANEVSCLALSNDGKFIATGSEDSSVKIWNYSDLKILKDLRRHKKLVSCILFMKTKHKVISSSWDSRIIIWNLRKGTEKVIPSGKDGIVSIDLTHDDLFLAYASWDLSVNVFDLRSKSLFYTFMNSMYLVKSLKFNKSGKYLICGSRDHSIYIQSIEHKKLHLQIRHHESYINCVCVSEDDKYIISGSSDKKVILNEFNDSLYHEVLWEHEADVICVEISRNNSFVVSAGFDQKIVIYSLIKNAVNRIINTPEYKARSIKMNLSSNAFLAVGEQRGISKYFISDRSCHQESVQHKTRIKCVKFFNSMKFALSYARDGIKVWDVNEANLINSIVVQGLGYNSLSIVKSENYYVLSKGNISYVMKIATILSIKMSESGFLFENEPS